MKEAFEARLTCSCGRPSDLAKRDFKGQKKTLEPEKCGRIFVSRLDTSMPVQQTLYSKLSWHGKSLELGKDSKKRTAVCDLQRSLEFGLVLREDDTPCFVEVDGFGFTLAAALVSVWRRSARRGDVVLLGRGHGAGVLDAHECPR